MGKINRQAVHAPSSTFCGFCLWTFLAGKVNVISAKLLRWGKSLRTLTRFSDSSVFNVIPIRNELQRSTYLPTHRKSKSWVSKQYTRTFVLSRMWMSGVLHLTFIGTFIHYWALFHIPLRSARFSRNSQDFLSVPQSSEPATQSIVHVPRHFVHDKAESSVKFRPPSPRVLSWHLNEEWCDTGPLPGIIA